MLFEAFEEKHDVIHSSSGEVEYTMSAMFDITARAPKAAHAIDEPMLNLDITANTFRARLEGIIDIPELGCHIDILDTEDDPSKGASYMHEHVLDEIKFELGAYVQPNIAALLADRISSLLVDVILQVEGQMLMAFPS